MRCYIKKKIERNMKGKNSYICICLIITKVQRRKKQKGEMYSTDVYFFNRDIVRGRINLI